MICQECGCPIPMIELRGTIQDSHGAECIVYECVECSDVVLERIFED